MALSSEDGSRVNARILYWGISGAGVTSNLRFIYTKLRSDHRGELRQVPTRLDPTVTYEVLPISLGEVNGVTTQLQITAVPSQASLTATRKQLLDEVDGVVLVIDAQADRAAENAASVEELRGSLADYGFSLEEMPLVVQYNKRDLTDDFGVEALHRQLGLDGHAVFEAVASEGKGVLKTLTTISKHVVRSLRDRREAEGPAAASPTPAAAAAPSAQPAPAATPPPAPAPAEALAALDIEPEPASARDLMEEAILAEAEPGHGEPAFEPEAAFDQPWDAVAAEAKPGGVRLGPDLRVVSVGTASRDGQRGVRVPLVLGNDDGETVSLSLTVSLDPLLDD